MNGSPIKKELRLMVEDIGELMGSACDECRDEISLLREDLQGQLQDIFIEVKALRKELIYFQSRIKK